MRKCALLVILVCVLAAGAAFALEPADVLLANVYTDNAAGTKLWRTVVTFTDGAGALAALGLGIYTIAAPSSDPEGWNVLIGALLVALSLPLAGLFGLGFIPYSGEKRVSGTLR